MKSAARGKARGQGERPDDARDLLLYDLLLRPHDDRQPLVAASKSRVFVGVLEGSQGASTLDEFLPALRRIVSARQAAGVATDGWRLEIAHVRGAIDYKGMEEVGRELLRRLVAAVGREGARVRAERPGFIVTAIPLTDDAATERDRVKLGEVELTALRERMRHAVDQSGLSYEAIGIRMGAPPSRNPTNVAWKFVHKSPDPSLAKLVRFARATAVSLSELLPPGLIDAGRDLTNSDLISSNELVKQREEKSNSHSVGLNPDDKLPSLRHEVQKLGAPIREALVVIAEQTIALIGSDYRVAHRGLEGVSRSFREIVAKVLEPEFNRIVKTIDQESYEDKKTLCKWINFELSTLGLAVRCPESDLPGIVSAGTGSNVDIGRFEFIYHTENPKTGAVQRRVIRRTFLPEHIDLIPSPRLARTPGWSDAAALTPD